MVVILFILARDLFLQNISKLQGKFDALLLRGRLHQVALVRGCKIVTARTDADVFRPIELGDHERHVTVVDLMVVRGLVGRGWNGDRISPLTTPWRRIDPTCWTSMI
jgi:hypothetical protein